MIVQLLGMAVIVAVLYSLLKKEVPAISILFAVAVALFLLFAFFQYLQVLLTSFPVLQDETAKDSFACLLKAAGVIVCADYARDLCKDAGSESMATCMAVAGRVMVIITALPLLQNVYFCILGLSQ